MTRTELINCFIRHRQYGSYLEIGTGVSRENFDRIQCAHKHGIDQAVDVEGVQHLDSDTFFKEALDTFDVIFIDGSHDEPQVDRDIANSLLRLNPGGVIIMHDCLPPDEWHQRPSCDYRSGENWNGTVWKSVLKYFALSEWSCYIVNCDWGCGVIDTARGATLQPHIELPVDLDYGRDFRRLDGYVLDEGRFLMQLYDVAVFYHIAAMGNWQTVVEEHFDILRAAELQSVRVSYVGCPDGIDIVRQTAEEAGVQIAVMRNDPLLTAYETPAMRMIQDWAIGAPETGSILYFHTKGVSAPNDQDKRKWRKLMNHEVLMNWQQLVPKLQSFDVIGVNWRNCQPVAHFSGNFWWARADWVRSLAPFDAYYENPLYPAGWDSGRRLGCEFWISSAPRTPRVLSLVCADKDFCNPAFWSYFSHPALR
jgi:hypothetical protein